MESPNAAAPPTVLVVIVNYKTPALVIDCLASLESEIRAHPPAQAVVVDNCSPDDSLEQIREAISKNGWAWAQAVRSDANGGFAYGNNHAIRSALESDSPPALLWLLNPDTLARPGAMLELIKFLQEHPQAGIAGGMLEEPDGRSWPCAFRAPSILSEVERGLRLSIATRLLERWKVVRRMGDSPGQVDWLPGASLMVRREVFSSTGLMDDGYFLYFEETDFCLQARRAGWQCWYVPSSRVMHIEGASTGLGDSTPRRVPAYWFDSRRRYFVKNHGRAYAAMADLAWAASFLLWRLRRIIQRKPDTDPPHLLRDFMSHSAIVNRHLPGNRFMVRPRDTASEVK